MSFTQGNRDMMATLRQRAMRDEARFFDVEEDTSTDDPYDKTETTHYDGKASVRTESRELQRRSEGDDFWEADAIIVLPLIDSSVEDALPQSRCEATFRGQSRTGTVDATRRRDVTVLVGVEWD